MKIFLILTIIFNIFSGSYILSKAQAADLSISRTAALPYLEALIERRDILKSKIPTCNAENAPAPQYIGMFSHRSGSCTQGDALMYMGMLCMSAVLSNDVEFAKKYCEQVELSQDEIGRFWRGPIKIGDENHITFSRDMGMGIISYVTAKGVIPGQLQDQEKTNQVITDWIYYLDHLNSRKGRMCPGQDRRCKIVSSYAALLSEVFQGANIISQNKKERREQSKISHTWKRLTRYTNPMILHAIEAPTTPNGYDVRLKAVTYFLLRTVWFYRPELMTKSEKKLAKMALKSLDNKKGSSELTNLMIDLLVKGHEPDSFIGIIENILHKSCPIDLPTDGVPGGGYRTEVNECIYLSNIIIGILNGKLNWSM